MPTYRYRPRTSHHCATCKGVVIDFASIHDPVRALCPDCGNEVYVSIPVPRMNLRRLKRSIHESHDYREDLARFKNDPDCYVDGPRALSKLKDKRKRAGWEMTRQFGSIQTDAQNCPTGTDPEQMKHEAYEEARATGFSLDDPDVQEFLGTDEE